MLQGPIELGPWETQQREGLAPASGLGRGAWRRESVSRAWVWPQPAPLHSCLLSLLVQPMNATSAFGPNLRYIVKWRRRETRETWNNATVWGSRYVVGQTPVYVPYEIRVQAENDFGKGPEPDTVIGYSGEDCEYLPPVLCPGPSCLGCMRATLTDRGPWGGLWDFQEHPGRTASYQEREAPYSDLENDRSLVTSGVEISSEHKLKLLDIIT